MKGKKMVKQIILHILLLATMSTAVAMQKENTFNENRDREKDVIRAESRLQDLQADIEISADSYAKAAELLARMVEASRPSSTDLTPLGNASFSEVTRALWIRLNAVQSTMGSRISSLIQARPIPIIVTILGLLLLRFR